MINRIMKGLFRRSPLFVQSWARSVRGLIWRRGLKGFLNQRPQVPPRTSPVSVVIPSYNDLPLLRKCLRSLNKTLTSEDEVIIVDDFCQPDNSRKLLKLERPGVRVILKESRKGFAVSVNRGMDEAKYDIVLLNSDIVALPNWIEYLQKAKDDEDSVGLISAKLLYPDGRIQYGGTFWNRWHTPQWFAHRFGNHKFDFPPSNQKRYQWGAGGACVYVPQATYQAIGGLDETYWLGFEDVDYAMKSWSAGLKSIFEPNALLFHLESATRGYHQGNAELRSMRTFWSKWENLHGSRDIDPRKVRILISQEAPPLWRQFSAELNSIFKGSRIIHTLSDESNFDGLTIVMSTELLTEAWLSHVQRGIAIALLEEVPRADSEEIALLQPEFEYIAPSSSEERSLALATGWPALGIVRPITDSSRVKEQKDRKLQILFKVNESEPSLLTELRTLFPETSIAVINDSEHLMDALRELAPQVFVNMTSWSSTHEVLLALSSGSVVMTVGQNDYSELLQNGLNAFEVPPAALAVKERLDDLLTNEQTRQDLQHNALNTVAREKLTSATRLRNLVAEAVSRRSGR